MIVVKWLHAKKNISAKKEKKKKKTWVFVPNENGWW